jgi:glycosyltransferase involved in cell wall biosynthesis
MRIAIFTDTFPPQINGVVKSLVTTANLLAARGHHLGVFTMDIRKLERVLGIAREVDDNIEVFRFFSMRSPQFYDVQLRAPLFLGPLFRLARFRADIVHCHTNGSMAWEALVSTKVLGVPLIGTHHAFLADYMNNFGLGFELAKKLTRRYLAAYYSQCRAVIAPSNALKAELLTYGCRSPVHVVSNPVDLAPFRARFDKGALKRKFNMTRPTIMHVGRLIPQKSVDVLLRAFALLRADSIDAELHIVGDGRERAPLEQLACELGVAAHVVWAGMRRGAELVERLAAGDIFASASKTETQGLVFLEAMAAGLPTVGVQAGGVPEYVQHGVNGLIAEPDAPESLADALKALIRNPELRVKLAGQGRRDVAAYDADIIVARIEEIFREIHCVAR